MVDVDDNGLMYIYETKKGWDYHDFAGSGFFMLEYASVETNGLKMAIELAIEDAELNRNMNIKKGVENEVYDWIYQDENGYWKVK